MFPFSKRTAAALWVAVLCLAFAAGAAAGSLRSDAGGGLGKKLAAGDTGSVTDDRDGKTKTYSWVKVGTRKWMTENLNYEPPAGNSWCNGTADSCAKYGRLYNWATAMGLDESYNTATWGGDSYQHEGICPAGWRVPNKGDWEALIAEAGDNTGAKLRAKAGWTTNTGTDDFGFGALPYGSWNIQTGATMNKGVGGFWWMSSEETVLGRAKGFHSGGA